MHRVFAFDLIRVVAIFLVLFAHTVVLFPLNLTNLSFFLPLYVIGQLGPGLFFLLSGALMLPRERERAFPWHWRRVGQFLFLIVFWSILTNAVLYSVDGAGAWAGIRRAVRENNVLVGGDDGAAGQLWFLWVMGGLYLSLPFLGRMTQGLRGREYVAFAALTCLLVLVPGTFDGEQTARTFLDPAAEQIYGAMPLYGSFLAWFLLGDFLVRFRAAEVLRTRVPMAGALLLLLLALDVYAAGAMEVPLLRAAGRAEMYLPVHHFARSIFIFLGAPLLFLLLSLAAPRLSRAAHGMEALSRDVFGVYLSHMLVLCLLQRGLASLGIAAAQGVPFGACILVGTAAVSFLVAQGLRRLGPLRFLVC